MRSFDLKGTERKEIGSKYAKQLRKEGQVPCIVYGNNNHINFTVSQKELKGAVVTPHVYIVNLNIDGKVIKTIIKDLEFHPVTEDVLHADFYAFADEQAISVKLPVNLVGLAPGVKVGGKMKQSARKVTVMGKAADLPEKIDVDISSLELEQSIKVADLKFDNFCITDPQDALICRILATRATAAAAGADKK